MNPTKDSLDQPYAGATTYSSSSTPPSANGIIATPTSYPRLVVQPAPTSSASATDLDLEPSPAITPTPVVITPTVNSPATSPTPHYEGSVYDSSLESTPTILTPIVSTPPQTSQAAISPQPSLTTPSHHFSLFHFNRSALLITIAVVSLTALAGLASLIFNSSLTKTNSTASTPNNGLPSSQYAVSNLPLGSLNANSALQVSEAAQLTINGQLQVNNTLVLTPSVVPTTPVTGQLFYDKSSNQPYYYNGRQFVSLQPTASTPTPVTAANVCILNATNCGFAVAGSGVTTISGLAGALTIANATGSNTTITIQDASTTQKGLAQFNPTNFSSTTGVINTIQGITTTSDVQFASLGLGTSSTTGNLTLGASGSLIANTLTHTSNGRNLVLNAGADNVSFANSNGTNTFFLPTTGGIGQVICTTAITCAAGGGQAVILEPQSGGVAAIQTANANLDALAINKVSGSGNLVRFQTAGVNALVITNTGATTIGSNAQAFTLQGNTASTITATSGANTTTFGFLTPTANRSLNLPDSSGTLCTTLTCATSSGSGGYIQNQNTAQQLAANFWIAGSGRADSALLTPSLDTATATALNIGATTATSISLGNTVNNVATTINGTALVKPTPTHDSTTAFQVQTAGATSVFNVDTTTSRASVGSIGTATAQLYVAGMLPTTTNTLVTGATNAQYFTVAGRYAYIANNATGNFMIIDTTRPTNMATISTTTPAGMSSPYAVAVAGRYAYVTNNSDPTNTSGLEILDISNPNAPVLVGRIGTNAANTGGARQLVVQGRYVFLVNNVTNTIQSFDVANPAAPVALATQSTGSTPISISIQGRYAYVTNQGASTFTIFDVSNPASIPAGTTWTTNTTTPIPIYVSGRYAYVMSSTSAASFQVFDISNPTTPSAAVGSTTGGSVPVSLYVQGRYAYVIYNGGNFQIFDISNPTAPSSIGTYATGLSAVAGLTVSGRYAYVTASTGLSSLDLGGTYSQQLETGGIETTTLQVNSNANFGNNVSIASSLQVGQSLQVSGNIGASGSVLFQNNANSTTAFQVQNAAGISVLNVDTTNAQAIINGNLSFVAGATRTLSVAAPVTNVAGSALTIAAGNGGAGATGVAGANLIIKGGDAAGTTGAATGGSTIVRFGSGINGGATGSFNIQDAAGNNYFQFDTSSAAGTPNAFGTLTCGLFFSNSCAIRGGAGLVLIANQSTAAININPGTAGALVKPSLDTTTAFQVQNAAGTGILTVDTTNALSILNGNLNFTTGANRTISVAIPVTNIAGNTLTVAAANGGAGATGVAGGNLTLKAGDGAGTTGAAPGGSTFIQFGNGYNGGANGTVNIQDTGGNTFFQFDTSNSGTLTCGVFLSNTCTIKGGSTLNLTNSISNPAAGVSLQPGTNGVLVTPRSNTTTAFQVQNASGQNLFNVDTVNAGITLNGLNSGALGVWSTNTNALTQALYGSASITANGYVYIIGGDTGVSTGTSTVYYAKLNANGSTGTWTTNTNALPQTRYRVTSITANGYVYVMGGENNIGRQSTVYYAKLNADGSTGTWTTNTNALPQTITQATSITANGYVYVMGGSGAGYLSTVYYAKLNADGSTGTWTTNTNALPQGLIAPSSVNANGYVYVMGGQNSTSFPQSTVYYAKLNADGSTGTWTTNTNALPQALYEATTVTANGYVYITGGFASAPVSTVYYAKLNADGSTGTWTTNTNALPAVRTEGTSIIANGYVYFIGGWATGAVPQSTVYYASTSRIQLGGSLDLVGLAVGTLSDPGSLSQGSNGGSITAGNITAVGALQVQGQGSFAQGLNANGNLTINGSAFFRSSVNSATALQVQNTAGSAILTADTTNGQLVLGNSSSVNGQLQVLNATNANTITIVAGATAASYSLTLPTAGPAVSQCLQSDATTASLLKFSACSNTHSKTIVLAAEYAGAVLDAGTGANNSGTMTSGIDLTGRENYYKWVTTQATSQSYDVDVQVPIPSDFSAWGGTPLSIDTYTTDTVNGTLQAEARTTAGTVEAGCNFAAITPTVANTWQTKTCTIAGAYTAGGYMTLRLRMYATSAVTAVRVGNITLNYNSAY